MLRSNSKKAAENVRQYILQDCDYLHENYGVILEGKTTDEILAKIFIIFCEEKYYDGEPSFAVFKDWAHGLAMGQLFCYYYNRSAVTDLGDILEETEEERNRYTESQAEEMLTRLIYRELKRAYDKYNERGGNTWRWNTWNE